MTDPRTGKPYDGPAAQWDTPANTGTYVGVPDAYKVQQGTQFDPRYINYGAGYSTQTPVMGVPTYRYSDIDALWGKPKGQVFDLQYKLYALGLLPSFIPGTMDQKTQAAAEKAFEAANLNGTTIEQMLNRTNPATGKPLGGGATSGGGGGSASSSTSTSTSSQTQRSINLTSREGAMAVLSNALAQELGRQPSQAELTRFTQSLNAAQRANPDVTTSTSSTTTRASQATSASGHTTAHSSSSTSGTNLTKQGNVDPGYEATQFAKSAPLAAERSRFQDSQFFDVIANMIGAK